MKHNKPSKRDNNTWAPVTSFRILAHVLLPLLGELGFKDRFMSFLKDKKDQIASFSALTGTTLSLIALAITSYSLMNFPKKPLLYMQFSKSDRYGLIAVTYNGGDAPCAEFKLEYPAQIGKVQHIVQYQQSVSPNAQINSLGIPFLPRSTLSAIGQCSDEKCVVNGTYLAPNKVFALKFPDEVTTINLSASCIGNTGSAMAEYET